MNSTANAPTAIHAIVPPSDIEASRTLSGTAVIGTTPRSSIATSSAAANTGPRRRLGVRTNRSLANSGRMSCAIPTMPSVTTPSAKTWRVASTSRGGTARSKTNAPRPVVSSSTPVSASDSSAPRSAHDSGWEAAANRVSRFQKPKELTSVSTPAPTAACPSVATRVPSRRLAPTHTSSPTCTSPAPTRPSALDGAGIPNSVGNERSPTPENTPRTKP